MEHNGFKIVVLMRLALVFPFNVLNYALGTSRLRFRDFFLGSLVGTVPGTFLYVYLGSIAMTAAEAKSPLGTWRWALYGLGLALAAATVALTVRYARRELERELPADVSASPSSCSSDVSDAPLGSGSVSGEPRASDRSTRHLNEARP